jgi:hypothetical protein
MDLQSIINKVLVTGNTDICNIRANNKSAFDRTRIQCYIFTVSQTNSIQDILLLNKKLPIGTNPNPSNKKLLKNKILLNSIINQVFRYLD